LHHLISKYKQGRGPMGRAVALTKEGDRLVLGGWDFVNKTQRIQMR